MYKHRTTKKITRVAYEEFADRIRFTFPSTLPGWERDACLDVYNVGVIGYDDADVRSLSETMGWIPRPYAMFGHKVPRDEVAYWNPLVEQDGEWTYTYSKRPYEVQQSDPGTAVRKLLTTVFETVKAIEGEEGIKKFKFALVVGYKDGADKVSHHQDWGHGENNIDSFTLSEQSRTTVQTTRLCHPPVKFIDANSKAADASWEICSDGWEGFFKTRFAASNTRCLRPLVQLDGESTSQFRSSQYPEWPTHRRCWWVDVVGKGPEFSVASSGPARTGTIRAVDDGSKKASLVKKKVSILPSDSNTTKR